jgi:hypothetical protein
MNSLFRLTLVFSLLITFETFAQKGFEFGPSFQFQNTWLLNKIDNDEGAALDFEGTYNFAYGAQIGYGFHARHGLRTGIFVSQQGQKYTTSEEYLRLPSAKYYTETEYIQIPVLYRYNGSLEIANSAFILTAGPQFGLLQKSSSTALFLDSLSNTALISDRVDTKSCFESMDISAQLGLGILARFSPKFHMNAMLNLNYSLQDIDKGAIKEFVRPGTKNAVVGVNVSFYVLLGGPEMATGGQAKMR